MRQYRGKNKDGKWVYGSLSMGGYQPYDKTATFIEPNEPILHRIPVLKETVGQWTGLKDKNGKEIYEGDIVKFKSGIEPETTTIEFQIHSFCSGFYPVNGANANCYWEVIGTIHDK